MKCPICNYDFDSTELTDRERQILPLMAMQQSYIKIAEALNITINTVKSHRVNIKRKLGFPQRNSGAQVMAYCFKHNVIRIDANGFFEIVPR